MKIWQLLVITLALLCAVIYAIVVRHSVEQIHEYKTTVQPGVVTTFENVPNPIQGSSPKLQGR